MQRWDSAMERAGMGLYTLRSTTATSALLRHSGDFGKLAVVPRLGSNGICGHGAIENLIFDVESEEERAESYAEGDKLEGDATSLKKRIIPAAAKQSVPGPGEWNTMDAQALKLERQISCPRSIWNINTLVEGSRSLRPGTLHRYCLAKTSCSFIHSINWEYSSTTMSPKIEKGIVQRWKREARNSRYRPSG
ncbi:hypothetical protein C8R44DRAFT_728189 [Mycena epipterygia]|nr:hypothetical protein C8R44DRAFT_728189 [Mycena epipterygia]